MFYWIKRTLYGLVIVVSALALITWLVWIPSPTEPAYEYVMAWGKPGAGPGQFNDPTGIVIHGNEVFVSDARNGRIQVFDLDGHYLRQIGEKGDGPGQLGRPMNLDIAGDELYVADYWNDRIQVYGLDGTPHRRIGKAGRGPGEFSSPGGVAVAANGDLHVADFYAQRVQHLDARGRFIAQLGTTGKVGIRAGEFNYPTDVALAADGALFVADGYNDRIQVFDPDGGLVRKWGGPFGMNIHGPFHGWFATVTSLDFDPRGNLWVADFYNNRVQKFTPQGKFLTSIGARGTGPGEFEKAIAVAAAGNGDIYVVDFGNNRIERWREPETHR